MAVVILRTETAPTRTPTTSSPATASSPRPAPTADGAKAAVKRCCAAWQRAFNACVKANPNGSRYYAAVDAGPAYRNAMPLLVDYQSIRSFMACLCHGILIDAIPKEKAGQLAYVAQVALGTVQRDLKPPKPTPCKASKSASK